MEPISSMPKKEISSLAELEDNLRKMETTFDETSSLIFDNGSDSIKYGLSGHPLPKLITFPDNTGIYPIKRGMIDNFEAITSLWSHAIDQELPKSSTNVVVIDSAFAKKQQRKELAHIFFEEFAVQSLAFLKSSMMSLFSTGKTKGLVLEIGEGVTSVVPIYESCILDDTKLFMDIAGSDITNIIRKALGVSETQAKIVKEKLAIVAPSSKDANDIIDQEHSLILPDGNTLKVMNKVRYCGPEILFNPTEEKSQSLQKMIADSIQLCPSDLKPNSIVLAGGSTLLKGLKERLKAELSKDGLSLELCMDARRKYGAWVGGSMLTSFTTFSEMRITDIEYKEDPELIFRKGLS